MRDRTSGIEKTVRALVYERHVTAQEGEQLLIHLLASRDPGFWNDDACKRIAEDVPRRRHLPTHEHHRFVASELDQLCNPHHPRGYLLAKRWLGDSLEAFEAGIRFNAGQAHLFLADNRLAYLTSVFVLIIMSANAPSALHHEQLSPFPPVFRRGRT